VSTNSLTQISDKNTNIVDYSGAPRASKHWGALEEYTTSTLTCGSDTLRAIGRVLQRVYGTDLYCGLPFGHIFDAINWMPYNQADTESYIRRNKFNLLCCRLTPNRDGLFSCVLARSSLRYKCMCAASMFTRNLSQAHWCWSASSGQPELPVV
jgi:hypothetical protein